MKFPENSSITVAVTVAALNFVGSNWPLRLQNWALCELIWKQFRCPWYLLLSSCNQREPTESKRMSRCDRYTQSCREETKGWLCKRAVLANVPLLRFFVPLFFIINIFVISFPFLVPSFRYLKPHSGSGGPGNIRQNHPFGNHPFAG